MKKIYTIFAAALVLVSCNENLRPDSVPGKLILPEIAINTEELTKGTPETPTMECYITITDSKDAVCWSGSYTEAKAQDCEFVLEKGNYTIAVSTANSAVSPAAFETPVYGASKGFTIEAGKDTILEEPIVLTLIQVKVTIEYAEDFLETITGDGVAGVSVDPEHPLEYAMSYNEGAPAYETRAGFFTLNNGDKTSLEIKYRGSVEGKTVTMTKIFTDIEPGTWRKIRFVKKVATEGNADFIITIDEFVEDKELSSDIQGEEKNLGEDPNAPQGDGGIQLVSVCEYDITEPIVVPADGEFVLNLKAIVPNKIKRFTVEIESDNDDFSSSVKSINDGSSVLDLVNPSKGAIDVFENILPFPHGSDLAGKTEIPFALGDAQAALLAFKGNHTFIMHVTDQIGCKNDISVVLVVE